MSNITPAKEKFDEAMADFTDHNYGKIIDLLTEAIAIDPEFELAIKSRGAAYLRLAISKMPSRILTACSSLTHTMPELFIYAV